MTIHDEDWSEERDGIELMIHAHVDGELDDTTARSIESRIAADPALATMRDSIMDLRAAMKRLPRPVVSDALQKRISAIVLSQPQLAASDPTYERIQKSLFRAPSRLLSGSYSWRALAASVVITAIFAGGAMRVLMLGNASDSFALAIADDHRRSLLAASPFDVASSDRHTVKPWLDSKLGISPPAPDLAAGGFALAGGRVEVLFGKSVPALVYRHHEHLISLVAEPSQDGNVSVPIDLSAGGFSMVKWSDGAFSYWAISDTEWSDLNDFVAQFRKAIIPK